VIVLPFIFISPLLCNEPVLRKFKTLSNVVFPEPLDPKMARTSPGFAIPLTFIFYANNLIKI
jgi:hypothetical protein